MENKSFEHRVSKGSKFNQIYIPKNMEGVFEVGDVVEVRLLRKKTGLFYSENLKFIGDFKEKIANEIFSCLRGFRELKRIFIIGSFLRNSDYKDIDLLVVGRKSLEKKVWNSLSEKIGMNFHVIIIPDGEFIELLRIDPIIRSMLFYSVSNKKLILPEKLVDKKHIQFLLMMPEDILRIDTDSRAFYDSLRRVFVILRFLDNKDEDIIEIDKEIKKETSPEIFEKTRNSKQLNSTEISLLRKIIKEKLKLIYKILTNKK